MKRSSLLVFLFLTMLSCDEEIHVMKGTYSGVYYRTDPNGNRGQVSTVTLTLDQNSFEGSSNIARYPAICEGTYSATTKSVNFTNMCVWTADFDWSLIISGEYKISRNGDKIFLTKKFNDLSYDTYEIRGQ